MNNEIIALLKDRLEIGKKEYRQEVDPFDGRDWIQEAIEEALDCCIYLATALLKLQKNKKGVQNDPEC
jgi:phage terminase large subunit GpA-like protein